MRRIRERERERERERVGYKVENKGLKKSWGKYLHIFFSFLSHKETFWD